MERVLRRAHNGIHHGAEHYTQALNDILLETCCSASLRMGLNDRIGQNTVSVVSTLTASFTDRPTTDHSMQLSMGVFPAGFPKHPDGLTMPAQICNQLPLPGTTTLSTVVGHEKVPP